MELDEGVGSPMPLELVLNCVRDRVRGQAICVESGHTDMTVDKGSRLKKG